MHCNIPIFIPHLGCPFHCIFCDQKRISSQHQVPGISEMTAIIEQHLATIPLDADIEIAFFGGNFTSLPVTMQETYLQAAFPYLKSGRVQSVRLSTRPDCIDPNILDRLAKYGVKTVELGVQSLDEHVLQASGRAYHPDQVFAACKLIQAYGMQLGIQLMVGLPGDNLEADLRTIKAVTDIRPDLVRIYPTLVIAGTALEEMYRQGRYTPLELPQAVKIVAGMYVKLQQHDIKVIRMGLQPSEDLLQPGTVVAGPFHPAFGELVEQEVCQQQARQAIKEYFEHYGVVRDIILFVNHREVSKLVGHKKNNIKVLQQDFQLDQIKVRQLPECESGMVGVASAWVDSPEVILTRKRFLENLEIENSTRITRI